MNSSGIVRSPWRFIKSVKPLPRLLASKAQFSVSTSYGEGAEILTKGSLKQELAEPHKPQGFEGVDEGGNDGVRLPRAVQAIYLRPLRREAKYNVPTCDLQLRSFSVRNLEFMADFALRAAYYLHLPAFGPIPLPRITQRWTVPRSHFIFKKSQENFERVTLRRLIQIKDGHPETMELWLAFLRKHAYYGVGMKANIWEYNELGVGKTMDVSLENMKNIMDPRWAHFGRGKTMATAEKVMELLDSQTFRLATTGEPPLLRDWSALPKKSIQTELKP